MTRRELLSAFALLPALGKPDEPCTGQIVASGRLSSADHESADGYFNVSECAIHVHPDGIPADILRGLRDRPVEVVIREIAPREPKRLER